LKIVFLTGSHTRHNYVAWQLWKSGLLQGLLVEQREAFIPEPPKGLNELDTANFIRHFKDRDASESRFLAVGDDTAFHDIPVRRVTPNELNDEGTKQWLTELKPDFVLSYGVHKIDAAVLEVMPEYAWNIHGGLSPWYRGNTTLFWPFYFMQPNWAGMTIHQLTAKLDGGPIIHHSTPELVRGDGIHDVASRAVMQVTEDLVRILGMVRSGVSIMPQKQKSSGKLFLGEDWLPQHLRVIYDTFDNDIVDRYLDGEFGHRQPPLIKAF
jgi:folate-dependent phosphoribosylglycinamide formyltransferase PurN